MELVKRVANAADAYYNSSAVWEFDEAVREFEKALAKLFHETPFTFTAFMNLNGVYYLIRLKANLMRVAELHANNDSSLGISWYERQYEEGITRILKEGGFTLYK